MSEREGFICELCAEHITEGQPHIRISADAAVHDGKGNVGALNGNKILVFAAFHSECVMDTMHNSECDDVPYVWEARSIFQHQNSDLCDECRDRVVDKSEIREQRKFPRLTVLAGGLVS